MPSSYTTRIRLEKQADGENANTWGLKLNNNVIDLVDEAVAGFEQIDVSAATSVSLTGINGTTDQSRNFGLKFIGAIDADVTVVMPAVEKIYFVRNDTSGDYNLMFKNAGGTAVTGVGQGRSMMLATDGTNITTMEEPDSTVFASAGTSATLQTEINANSTAIATVSSTMATSISNSNTAIATVSATMATSINNANVTRASTSATLNTRIANVSAAIPTNNNQLTNGAGYSTFTANQSLNNTAVVAFEGLMIGQTSGATSNTIRCVGDVVAFYSSDERLKNNIEPIKNSLDIVGELTGYEFDWDEEAQDVYTGHDIGVIAQEVERVLPDLVETREYNGYKAVKYEKLIAVLINAINELAQEVKELKGK